VAIKNQANKVIEIVAGPNGSGKSTFAESFFLRTKHSSVFLNPDLIASGIAPGDFEKAAFQAGRILINEVKSRIARSESFSFESTLSGKSWLPILAEARERGFTIIIYFIYLDNVAKNLKRIRSRVKLGGHNVPSDAVRRRYPRCFRNFWFVYRTIAADWYIFNNSSALPELTMSKYTFDRLPKKLQTEFFEGFVPEDLR
jgi:predicted ABC-type ATPase